MAIHSDRRYVFTAPTGAVWAALTNVDDYLAWWPWLVRFDGNDFRVGARWHCTVRSPLRYGVRFEIELTEVTPPTYAAAEVVGDISGPATLELTDTAGGSELRLRSHLSSNVGLVATVDRLVPRLAELAHHRILDDGFRQFRDRNCFGGTT